MEFYVWVCVFVTLLTELKALGFYSPPADPPHRVIWVLFLKQRPAVFQHTQTPLAAQFLHVPFIIIISGPSQTCQFAWPHLDSPTSHALHARAQRAVCSCKNRLDTSLSCFLYLELPRKLPASPAPTLLAWQNVTHSSRTGFSIGCKNCANFCRMIRLGLI